MTDKQIIKAWKDKRTLIELDESPTVSIELITNTLDLINRKDAEIDKLKWDINWYKDKLHHLGEMLEGK